MKHYSYDEFCLQVEEKFILFMSEKYTDGMFTSNISQEKINSGTTEEVFSIIPNEHDKDFKAPMIPLKTAYNMFRNGKYELDEYIKNLASTYEKNYKDVGFKENNTLEKKINNEVKQSIQDLLEKKSQDIKNSTFDLNYIKERLFLAAVNKEHNEVSLCEFPHIIKGDLALVCRLFIGNIDDEKIINNKSCITVDNQILNNWNISKSEMFDLAYLNSDLINLTTCNSISDYLDQDFSKSIIEPDGIMAPEVYVLSNENNFYGAASMFCNSNKIKELAESLNSNVFIMPISVHEVFCIADSDKRNFDIYNKMLHDINVNIKEQKSHELLGKQAMYFDRELNRMIQFDGQSFSLDVKDDKKKIEKRR